MSVADFRLKAAREAAAKVNEMLVATGHLRQSDLEKPSAKPPKSSDLFVEEVTINDAPMSARNFLTRSSTQEEISKMSGASVSTRGRYMTAAEISSLTPGSSDRPLYLHIQGINQTDVKVAVGRIMHLIMEHTHRKAANSFKVRPPSRPVFNRPPFSNSVGSNNSNNSRGSFNGTAQPISTTSNIRNKVPKSDLREFINHKAGKDAVMPIVKQTHEIRNILREKVFIPMNLGLDPLLVRQRILGDDESNLQYIREETRVSIVLKGMGSGFKEPNGLESQEGLHFYLEHSEQKMFEEAKDLLVNLTQTVIAQLTEEQQNQSTQIHLTSQPPPTGLIGVPPPGGPCPVPPPNALPPPSTPLYPPNVAPPPIQAAPPPGTQPHFMPPVQAPAPSVLPPTSVPPPPLSVQSTFPVIQQTIPAAAPSTVTAPAPLTAPQAPPQQVELPAVPAPHVLHLSVSDSAAAPPAQVVSQQLVQTTAGPQIVQLPPGTQIISTPEGPRLVAIAPQVTIAAPGLTLTPQQQVAPIYTVTEPPPAIALSASQPIRPSSPQQQQVQLQVVTSNPPPAVTFIQQPQIEIPPPAVIASQQPQSSVILHQVGIPASTDVTAVHMPTSVPISVAPEQHIKEETIVASAPVFQQAVQAPVVISTAAPQQVHLYAPPVTVASGSEERQNQPPVTENSDVVPANVEHLSQNPDSTRYPVEIGVEQSLQDNSHLRNHPVVNASAVAPNPVIASKLELLPWAQYPHERDASAVVGEKGKGIHNNGGVKIDLPVDAG